MPLLVPGDRLPQRGYAEAGGVLVLARSRSAATARAITVGRPVDVGEALAEVDRPGAHRERGHLGEDRRRDALEAGWRASGPEPHA